MIRILGIGAALALASSAALAFEEEQVAAPPAARAAQSDGAPAAGAAVPKSEFEAGTKEKGGTEVRIPGLGKLGVLPKMDFGLELLYGAAETERADEQPEAVTGEDEDLMIRGTVKHRF